ncbi:MAG: AAA family ATPase [Burkholderiaceae bacterium]|nr:AAA family ATPase [Burkholderiaceae bacterium]
MKHDPKLSLLAEQSLLGCLLLDNAAHSEVTALVDPGSFGHAPYGLVFKAIGDLVAQHEAADAETVCEHLRLTGGAEAVGDLEHLQDLASSVVTPRAVLRYAEAVAEQARHRALLDLAEGMPGLVGRAASAEAAIDQLQAALAQLQRTAGRGEPKALATFVAEAVAEVNAVAAGDRSPGWPTGLASLDKALGGGLKPGRVVVVAARTSVGKTSLATQVLLHLGRDAHQGLMLSQEMTGAELAARALAHRGHIAMDRLATAELLADEWSALPMAADELATLPVWLDDTPALRLVDIAAKARAVKRRHGLCLLVVDYLQLCAAEQVKGQSRHHQIEGISRGIKALAKELGIAVLLLSQLNRGAEDGEPELHHLKESGAVEEDADTVLLLHPMGNEPGGAMTVLCKIAKNRGGRRVRIALGFDGRHQAWVPSNSNVERRQRGAA